MINKIKKLYIKRFELLFNIGIERGKIKSFDEDFYDKLKYTYSSGLPISIHVKYIKPNNSNKYYNKNFYMFFCFEDALLVSGDSKILGMKYDKDIINHEWIEIGDYVYDSTFMKVFEKDLYYKLIKPNNIKKYTHEEYKKENTELYENIMNTTIHDFQVGESKRNDFIDNVKNAFYYAQIYNKKDLEKELQEFIYFVSSEKELLKKFQFITIYK